MATTVVKSIGTSSRDYSTLQSWEDASPSDLTATRSNTCTGGTTSTIILDAGASAVNDFYTGHTVTNASAEERLITAYNGTTKIATIGVLNGSSATWTTPITGQAFTINSVIWQGQAYNDSEFTKTTTHLVISGETVGAASYIELTAASGQSFQDAPGVRTNALKYNQSNGVAIRNTVSYNRVIDCGVNYTRISRIQIKHDGNNSSNDEGIRMVNITGAELKDCITDTENVWGANIFGANLVLNVISFLRGSSGDGMRIDNGAKAIGCTVIRTTDQSPAGTGFKNFGYGSSIIQSCASFGFTTCASASNWDTTNSKNNATDLSSGFPGSTGNQYSITFSSTSPFTNSTVASQNSIPVSGTNLTANGFLDATNAPRDITGTVRANPPTIGCWELTGLITLVANTGAGSTTGNNVTTSGIDTTGANLIVISATRASNVTETISDSKGNTWTALTTRTFGSQPANRLYYCVNPTVGSGHTFTSTTTSGFPAIAVAAFVGVKTTSPFDVENGFTDGNNVTSRSTGSITPGENNELVIAGLGGGNTVGQSINTNLSITTTVPYSANNYSVSLAYIVQTTAAAINPAWAWTTSSKAAVTIASFKAATAVTTLVSQWHPEIQRPRSNPIKVVGY